MMKSATVSAEQSETAMEAADRLVRFATQLLELAHDIHHEVELAGEVPDAFVKRLRSAMVEERKALQALLGSVQT